MLIGFAYSRLCSWKRVSVRPVDIAWFCSGHSPPLSHIGQSSGWLISSSSMIPSCAFLATGEVSWVRTTMPSATVWVQEATGLRWPSTSTRHCRQAPAGLEQRVVAEPRDLDAQLLGDPDEQRALGRGHLDAVDGERDGVGRLRRLDRLQRLDSRHQCAPTSCLPDSFGAVRPSM